MQTTRKQLKVIKQALPQSSSHCACREKRKLLAVCSSKGSANLVGGDRRQVIAEKQLITNNYKWVENEGLSNKGPPSIQMA